MEIGASLYFNPDLGLHLEYIGFVAYSSVFNDSVVPVDPSLKQ